MYLILVLVVWVVFAYKFVDWTQWRKQYPTILFLWSSTLHTTFFIITTHFGLLEELLRTG
ncbi:hypothetical protein ACTWQB_01570 [Piscibacillus sp. B03]